MEILLIIFAPILIAALLAFIVLFFSKSNEIDNDMLFKQSQKGTKSVLHHNFSYKVADCMEGAKKTLERHGITVKCANFVQKY